MRKLFFLLFAILTYSQQETHIQFSFDASEKKLSIEQNFTFTNTSSVSLNELVLLD
jgi:hypothetical protein